MTPASKAVRRLAFKLAGWLILRQILLAVAIWGFLWGTLVLALRIALEAPRLPLMWGAAGIIPAVILALLLARRRLPSAATARALLDRANGCGGLLMAGGEIPLGSWQAQIPPLRPPRLRWRGGRILALFATAALFVAICFVVPSRFISAGHARALEIENEVAELTAKVEMLKDEKLLESSRAELLEERLQQVKQDASGEDPVRTWESLDHLENTISREAEKVAHASLDLTDKLTKSETLAEALLRSGADSNNSEVMAEALQEFLGAIGGSAQSSVLAKDLLAGDWKKGALNPDRLKSLSQSLRLTKAEILERLQRLHRLKLIDLDVVTRCKGLGKCNPDALAAFLGEDPGKACVADLVQALGSAPTRGRGDAEMTLRDEVSENGAKFKNEVLPPSAIVDQGELIGLSAGAPTASKAPSITNPGALDNAATAGGGAHTQVVLPRHRGTVKRYFDRP